MRRLPYGESAESKGVGPIRNVGERVLARLGLFHMISQEESSYGCSHNDIPPLDMYIGSLEPVDTDFEYDPRRPRTAHEQAAIDQVVRSSQLTPTDRIPQLYKRIS